MHGIYILEQGDDDNESGKKSEKKNEIEKRTFQICGRVGDERKKWEDGKKKLLIYIIEIYDSLLSNYISFFL